MTLTHEVAEAIEAISHDDGCYGVCDAGSVRGSHLANHTANCARMRILLGQQIPDGYAWNGSRLVYQGGSDA